MASTTSWTQFLGVSLRPFTGYAPLSLIVRGALQSAICVFFLVVGAKMNGNLKEIAALDEGAKSMRGLFVVFGFALVLLLLYGLVKIVVGILDLVPRTSVQGTVVSISERKFLDFLPDYINNVLWDRKKDNMGQSWSDRRKKRHEVVLDVGEGNKAWTVRNAKKANALRPGQRVTLTVSPIVGYVETLETHS